MASIAPVDAGNRLRADERRIGRSLDGLNFFLADVRDGLGPYLAIYLLAVRDWNEGDIGLVMTVGGIAAVLSQTPAGALIDASRYKRALVVIAALLVTIGSLAVPLLSSFTAVAASQAISGVAAAIFQPALAALTLGLMGPRRFTRRIARNEAFNHAGNATAAIAAGGLGYAFGPIVVFWLMAVMALLSIVAVLRVPADRIDHDLARGLSDAPEEGVKTSGPAGATHPSGLRALLHTPGLALFAVTVVMFHFANAAMLPLVGQKLALLAPQLATTLMSVCIIAAQIIMIPVSLAVGARVDRVGRKPIFLLGLGVLALRGALYVVSDEPAWLLAVQCLDGIGAGIFGVLFPVIVNDLTRGSGRFNVSLGFITTASGLGGALSNAVAGQIVVRAGYSAAFLFLAGVAAAGAVLFAFMMPETTSEAMPETMPETKPARLV